MNGVMRDIKGLTIVNVRILGVRTFIVSMEYVVIIAAVG